MDIDIKRASLLSDKVVGLEHEINRKDLPSPDDKFHIAILFAFFMGICGTLPMTFFLNANDYWMYKFRDPANATYDLNNKTTLQTMFASGNAVASAIPSIASVLLTATYSHKLAMRSKFMLSVGCMSLLFIIFTSTINLDTDEYQTAYFFLVLVVIGVISCFLPLIGMSVTVFFSRFPKNYLKINILGSAVGGLFGSTLQIIALSIGGNSKDTALIYFSTGTALIVITFVLSYSMKFSPVVQFYWQDSEHKEGGKRFTVMEYWNAAKMIWPLLTMLAMTTMTVGFGHANITSLVVSEKYTGNNENLWYDKYFVVVATYFAFDFYQLIGRFFVNPVITEKNYIYFMIFAILRASILVPLLLFCNAQPRPHGLPVWFPHDYQYMIILAFNGFTFSLIMSFVILSVPNFAKEKTEVAFMLLLAFLTCSITFTSPLSPFIVKLL